VDAVEEGGQKVSVGSDPPVYEEWHVFSGTVARSNFLAAALFAVASDPSPPAISVEQCAFGTPKHRPNKAAS
jgi:hypothetical protein